MPKVLGYKLVGFAVYQVVRCAGCKRPMFNGERAARPTDSDTLPNLPIETIEFVADASRRLCPRCA
jgi:hypothetical protein